MDLAHPEKDLTVWERAIRKLQGGMMPPPGPKRPDPATVDTFVNISRPRSTLLPRRIPIPGRCRCTG